MIRLKTEKDIEMLRVSGKKLHDILDLLELEIKPGVSTLDLENLTRELIKKEDCVPAFLGYKPYGARRPYPAALCVSINEEVVHGIPNENPKILNSGDIVTIDCGLSYQGFFTDSARTLGVGKIDARASRLIEATKKALAEGIKSAKPGARTGDIGFAVAKVAIREGFSLAENLGGHGVGFSPHEDPFIPNFDDKGKGDLLKEGMVIAIEPMLNEGSSKVRILSDGYTFVTVDKKRSAHVEHTVVITKKGSEILT